MGELGVAVGDVGVGLLLAVVGEGLDYDAQVREALVDVVGLLQTHARCARLGLSLRPSQIHNIELGLYNLALAHLLIIDGKHRMAPGGVLIHSMRANYPNLLAIIEQFLDFSIGLTKLTRQPLYKHRRATRHNLQLLIGGIQQIPQLLIVDFQI